MHPLLILIAGWVLSGAFAVGGSILGNAFGEGGLFAGAVVGGVTGVAVAVWLSARLGWIAAGDRLAAFLGGCVGFAIAAAIAAANLHTPVIPVLSAVFTGVGILSGIGAARGARAPG